MPMRASANSASLMLSAESALRSSLFVVRFMLSVSAFARTLVGPRAFAYLGVRVRYPIRLAIGPLERLPHDVR